MHLYLKRLGHWFAKDLQRSQRKAEDNISLREECAHVISHQDYMLKDWMRVCVPDCLGDWPFLRYVAYFWVRDVSSWVFHGKRPCLSYVLVTSTQLNMRKPADLIAIRCMDNGRCREGWEGGSRCDRLHKNEMKQEVSQFAPKSSYQKPITHPTFGAESYRSYDMEAQVRKTKTTPTWRFTGRADHGCWTLAKTGYLNGQRIMLYISSNSVVYYRWLVFERVPLLEGCLVPLSCSLGLGSKC